MSTLQRIGILALLGILGGYNSAAWAGSIACPGTGRALLEKADRTIEALVKAADAGDRKLRCKTSAELVILERKLLEFYERYQIGCVIDVGLIEDQQDRIKRAERWAQFRAGFCEQN